MKRKTKKYALGTKVKSYIEKPGQALQENALNLDKSYAEGMADPLASILSQLGGLAMKYGMDQFGKVQGTPGQDKAYGVGAMDSMQGIQDSYKNMLPEDSSMFAAFGGKVPKSKVEVEGKEVAETPDGQLLDFKGASHENGGMEMELPIGTEIFSKRIKVGGKTMAERKKKREKRTMTLENLLSKNENDKVLKDTLKRTLSNNEIEEEKDKQLQEMISSFKKDAKLAYGTGSKGVEKYADGGKVKDFFTNLASKDFFENLTGGDLTGLAGTLYSSLAPMENTRQSRAGDTPNISAYENFGADALKTIEDSGSYIEGQKQGALSDLDLSRASAIKRGRSSARGINQMRALDIASTAKADQAEGDIYDTFSKQMMNILSQKAGLQTKQDQMTMGGEQAKDLADRQDRDAFYSQMAQDIATKGEGIQTMGKMFNQSKRNAVSEKAVNSMSKYGFKWDKGNLVDTNGIPMNDKQKEVFAKQEGYSDFAAWKKANIKG